jgi:hypothetical protein
MGYEQFVARGFYSNTAVCGIMGVRARLRNKGHAYLDSLRPFVACRLLSPTSRGRSSKPFGCASALSFVTVGRVSRRIDEYE